LEIVSLLMLPAVVVLFALMPTTESRPPPEIFTIWALAILWSLYRTLFRVAYRLEVVSGMLTWDAPFRRGEVPVSDITEVRRSRMNSRTAVIKSSGRQSVVVAARDGFEEFTNSLVASNRSIAVKAWRSGLFADVLSRRPTPFRKD
jgi:hypothetical protein